MKRISRSVILVVLAWVVGAADQLRAQHLDMMLFQEGGELKLGGYEFAQLEPVFGSRVFRGSTRIPPSAPGLAWGNNPGWSAIPTAQLDLLPTGAAPLPPEASVSFDIVPSILTGLNLSHWDGIGATTFGPVPADEVAVYGDELFVSSVLIDGSASAVDGFEFATTTETGYLHVHVPFSIFGNSDLQVSSTDSPTPGVYLLEIAAEVEGLDGRPSAHVLLGVDVDDAALEIANQWVSTLVVPEPSTLAVFMVFLIVYTTSRL